jgi:hypothetical protein
LRSSEGLERYFTAKIKAFTDAIETSIYGEIEALNDETVDVYLPSRDVTVFDLPVFTLQGGGEYIQFPVKVGDKCIIIFTKDSAIDWLSGNDVSSSYNFDLSNGFALVGIDTIADPLPLTTITTLKVTKVKIENDTAEIITTLSDTMQKLIDTMTAIQALTVTCAGPGNPSSIPINASDFATISSELTTLKSQIDSFKE